MTIMMTVTQMTVVSGMMYISDPYLNLHIPVNGSAKTRFDTKEMTMMTTGRPQPIIWKREDLLSTASTEYLYFDAKSQEYARMSHHKVAEKKK